MRQTICQNPDQTMVLQNQSAQTTKIHRPSKALGPPVLLRRQCYFLFLLSYSEDNHWLSGISLSHQTDTTNPNHIDGALALQSQIMASISPLTLPVACVTVPEVGRYLIRLFTANY